MAAVPLTEGAARESEERFRILFDRSPAAVVLMSAASGRIVEINATSLSAFGYSREEVIGRTPAELGIWVSPGPGDRYLERLRAEGRVSAFEVEMRRKDGSTYPALLDGTLVRIGSGDFALSTIQDMTLRKRAETSLSLLNAELEDKVKERTAEMETARRLAEQASEAKSQFLANMSHEIRTPLNGVLGMIDVLRQTTLRGQQAQMADLVHESAQSLLAIIEDILDFSKIEAGMVEIERAPMSIGGSAEKVCELLDQMAFKKGVEIMIFTDPRLPETVMGDAMRVRQILHNVVGNAIKFSSAQAQPRKVTVRADLVEDAPGSVLAQFQVTDNGIGMDQDALSRLFNSFTQADASITRRFGGSGLGLSISRNLVRLMGGEIHVTSAPGLGSTFSVRLPFDKALPVEPAEPWPPVSGLACLVIGEASGFARDLVTYLGAAGARVERAADLDEARSFAARCPPGPWIWIVDEWDRPTVPDEVKAAADLRVGEETTLLILGRGRRRRPRHRRPYLVEVDGNVLGRRTFLKAVAMAGGRLVGDVAVFPQGPSVGFPLILDPVLRSAHVILVAEDNKVNQLVIQHQLRSLGYAADLAPDGREALERWTGGNYALVITDLQMPEMDGYELSAAIRAVEEEKGREPVPIIALTANALKDEAARCQAAGMNDYLSKPAGLPEVKAMLEKWLPAEPPSENEP